MTAYGDREYRAARRRLERAPAPCWKACGRPATTIDHVPALARHAHVAGTQCCTLLPACAPCNMGDGARIGNRRRTSSLASRRW